MDRFGIGYEALRALNPRLIYCAVSGFGQNGPERGTAAFDGKLQAMSGIMSITGHEDKGPTRAGFALCDTIGGMTAAFAVASALFQRSHTGEGQFVDVAMLDAALAFLAPQIAEYTVTGHKHRQFGNLSSTGKVTGNRFKAGEGDLMLAVMTEKQFANLMTRARPPRRARRPALRRLAEPQPATSRRCARSSRRRSPRDSARNWEKRLTEADVPCAAIWPISEIVHHPQLDHREVHAASRGALWRTASRRLRLPSRA